MTQCSLVLQRQKRIGLLFLMVAGGFAIVGVVALKHYGFPLVSYLGILPPIAILTYYGYKNITASKDGIVRINQEAAQLYYKAGYNAFWILIAVILTGGSTNILPDRFTSVIYLFSGLVFYLLFLIYYKSVAKVDKSGAHVGTE